MHTGPNIENDGLVFYYDTGNKKSFVGEPTENLVPNSNFDNDLIGWGKNQDVTLEFISLYDTIFLKMITNQNTSTPGLISNPFAVEGGVTYTLSVRAKNLKSGTGPRLYATGNGTGGANIIWTSTTVIGQDLAIYQKSFTSPNDMTSLQVGVLFQGMALGDEVLIEYFQLEKKPYATPFTTTSRSTTQSLLDLMEKNQIDLTNMGFNGSGMVFDGTSSYMVVAPTALPVGDEVSCEIWNYGNSFLPSSIIECFDANGLRAFNIHLTWSGGIIYFDAGQDGAGYDRIFKTATSAEYNGWHQWVFTKNAVTGIMTIYLDSLEWFSGIDKFKSLPVVTSVRIGSQTVGNFHNGKVPIIKIYNKALTPQQIKNNFNSLKNRFGL